MPTHAAEAVAVAYLNADGYPDIVFANHGTDYSTNGGQDWNDIDITPNTGSYEWDPVPIVDSNRCLVRVSDVYNPNLSDTSEDVFSIRIELDKTFLS